MRRAWPILLAAVLTLGAFVGVRIRDTTPVSLGFHWGQAAVAIIAVMLAVFLWPIIQKSSSRARPGNPARPIRRYLKFDRRWCRGLGPGSSPE